MILPAGWLNLWNEGTVTKSFPDGWPGKLFGDTPPREAQQLVSNVTFYCHNNILCPSPNTTIQIANYTLLALVATTLQHIISRIHYFIHLQLDTKLINDLLICPHKKYCLVSANMQLKIFLIYLFHPPIRCIHSTLQHLIFCQQHYLLHICLVASSRTTLNLSLSVLHLDPLVWVSVL